MSCCVLQGSAPPDHSYLAHAVGQKTQRPIRRDFGVQLAHRPGGRVAGVGEDLASGLLLGLIQLVEMRLGHHHFAPDFQQLGNRAVLRPQPHEQVAHRAHIAGDLLPCLPVPTGHGGHVFAALVDDLHGQPVQLGVGPKGRLRVLAAFLFQKNCACVAESRRSPPGRRHCPGCTCAGSGCGR